MAYPKAGAEGVPARPHFPDVELDVLDYWEKHDIFHESVAARKSDDAEEFVFYDGPPFANGLPHYGHLLAGYAKDVVPRYQTMRGRRVERRFGWTSHGLPAELDAEKQLGITAKSDIERMGVERFNEVCRTTVMRYTGEWRDYVNRQARWVDFDESVKTHDLDYMESVMWAFKTMWDKGLIYQGHSVSWYCAHCETPLANAESSGRIDGSDTHRDVPGNTVVVGVRLDSGELLLVESDQPWALPGATAVAVHPDAEYAVVEHAGRRLVVAADRLGAHAELVGDGPVVARHSGAELAGRAYTPLFDFSAPAEDSHVVVAERFVDTDEGTGAVAVTPCFDERDHTLATDAGIGRTYPVDSGGRYTDEVPPCAGAPVLESAETVTGLLAASGALLSSRPHTRSRPHCWRCGNQLLQQAIPTWFVAVTRLRTRMLELNERIQWTPEHVRDGQFGNWVRGAKDWNISRNRYWGAPIPVWVSDDPAHPRVDVYGSLDEIERDFGVRPSDLHRPYIDELTRPNPDDPSGRAVMRRVPEVLDCWFETGSMPFAQVHYPFENAEWFERHSPGDFVVEYYAQTRGWFYNMHVMSTALFDRPAFANCTVLGVVLGHDGQAMSKARNNYLDVNDIFARDGSDAMRWFLMSSPLLRARDLEVTEAGSKEALRQVLLPLWNAWHFLALYAGDTEGHVRTEADHPLDRYLLAKTRDLVELTTGAMDGYDLSRACSALRDHLDVLTNWYIRCSRDRFAAGDRAAVDTLHTALEVLCRLMAPLLPLITERIWRGLTGGRSVHLTSWPTPGELPSDPELVRVMDRVREVASTALGQRKSHQLRLRLPLARLVIADPDAPALEPYTALLRDQLNVKDVQLTTDVSAHGRMRLTVDPRKCGPRLGGAVQEVIRAAATDDWTTNEDGHVVAAGRELLAGEYELRLVADGPGAVAALPGGAGLVVLDVEVTEELAAEGAARDLVRVVQQARRAAGFEVSDHIALSVDLPETVAARIRAHDALLKAETLAGRVTFGPVADAAHEGLIGEGTAVRVHIDKL
ncbi:isoleucine--tRNA ligase [Streptomyces sp. PSAA01]|uniref:isoleucine--tRNA ligase n=1 Tax=Streptomyces sp. PSAA01 TaxID=2912762 RepID=UPI001F00CC6D|nr:isoleucine--tRNA ligase [Streptomyces sp. PSAA01]MCG0283478.1 isoleucine--tRNA ligase [Streptomyces sp. PSAA01]